MTDDATTPDRSERRETGLRRMADVYGWEVSDGPGDFFAMTVEHLFAEVWTRPGMTDRDRRLLLIGVLAGRGMDDVVELQLDAALRVGDFDDELVREIVILLTHYAGWPTGAKLNSMVETMLAKRAKAAAQAQAAAAAAGDTETGTAP